MPSVTNMPLVFCPSNLSYLERKEREREERKGWRDGGKAGGGGEGEREEKLVKTIGSEGQGESLDIYDLCLLPNGNDNVTCMEVWNEDCMIYLRNVRIRK
jgi:hypothetical protein